jgi:G:T-mismatch repair DNA endonuclease (very short patch repair protein)
MDRDSRHQSEMEAMRWNILIVWECEMNNLKIITEKIDEFLSGNNRRCTRKGTERS